MFGGPFRSLYLRSFLPCCRKEEDKNALEALNQINTAGARILWHRDMRGKLVENVKQAAFSFFSSKKKPAAAGGDEESNPIVKAQFRLLDNEDGVPEIRIAKRGVVAEETEVEDWDFGMDVEDSDPADSAKTKHVPDKNRRIEISLKRIHTVVISPQENLVLLNILTDDGRTTKEWAKFSLEAQDQEARNMFVHNLQVLMEWDKQRRNECGELEYDETSAASSLKARAQKAAHFARREIELKQTRRSREERKAKYVQESGGLKYTALAMARNAGAT